ncbi:uncharacterized protein LOC123263316 [Cotesia glomerata]|uniref:Uncharacterized protein n=1 Tax=Cotesia glomerata TaxID=32391 RepID=A0AAV7IR89_COTGL|nr:uncharacterized protein LOC123263316 [Cotesia glomerata]KAH0554287.1 hypothetical protein KQX54_009277 [Cotesia glomerata]
MEVPKNLEDVKKLINSMENDVNIYNLKMEENDIKRLEIERSICETEMLIEKALHIIKTNQIKNEDYFNKISKVGNNFKTLSEFTSNSQKNKSVDNQLVKVKSLKKDKINHRNEFDKINYSTIDLQVKKEAIQQVKKKFIQLQECSKEILSKLNEF